MADSLAAVFKRPWDAQLAYFRQKLNLGTERWTDIMKGQHDKAFVVAGAKVEVAGARSPLWLLTVMATPAIMAAPAPARIRVPVPISWAWFTPAGLPGAKAPSAAKAEEPIIVATVTAATTDLIPNIGFPRYLMPGYLSEAQTQVNRAFRIPF